MDEQNEIKTLDPAEATVTGKDLKRLMDKVEVDPVADCWTWTGGATNGVYPGIRINGRFRKPHRVLFKLLNPSVDIEDLSVRPACNNPLCVNPDHQEIRGYGYSGHKGTPRKLTPDSVKTIKRLLLKGLMTQQEIAEVFGVSNKTISHINTGSLWASVQP